MYRYSFLTWAPAGHILTDEQAVLLAQKEGRSKGIPPALEPCIEVRPVEVAEDVAGYVDPRVDGWDFYVLEYEVDLDRIRNAVPCPAT